MNVTICEAIKKRMVIRFYYDGGIRIVEPHCHGIRADGTEVLRAYQIGGHSKSGHPVGWKLIELGKISGLQHEDTTFTNNRPGYNPSDQSMSSIHCAL